MLKHIELNRRKTIAPAHFERWLWHWKNTVEENFRGEKAEEAVKKANQIASLMKYKIEQQKWF